MNTLNTIRASYIISSLYLIFGLLWIYLTDDIIHTFAEDDTQLLTQLQNYKGWSFVLMSTILVFAVTEALITSLIKSKNRYKIMFESNPIPSWICDKNTRKIIEVNIAAIEQYGYTDKEFKTMKFEDLKADFKIENGIEKHLLKDTTEIFVEISSKEIQFEGKTCELIVAQNRTEKIKGNQEIRRLNQELEETIKKRTQELTHAIQELESFNFTVSHDLRSPIRNAMGMIDIVRDKKKDNLDSTSKELIDNTHYLLSKANTQIQDLLAFSLMGKREKHLEVVNMKKLFEDAFTELKLTEFKNVNYDIQVKDIPNCHADPQMIKHVVYNLVSNALKFTSRVDHPKIIVDGMTDPKNEETIYYIKDNGIGFNMKYVDQIFKVFRRLHSEMDYKGNGAGLAIAERIIMRHGGGLKVEAEVDKGATFYFTIPGIV